MVHPAFEVGEAGKPQVAGKHEAENWFREAKRARTLPEMLAHLHRAHRVDPTHPHVQSLTRQALWRILQEEPFLAYKDESDQLYYVWNGLDLTLTVLKNRTAPAPYPPPQPSPLAPAWRTLGWAALGLSLAGMGTLVLAPLALFRAVDVLLNRPLDRADWARAVIVMALSLLLWGVGVALGLLLLLHFLS